MEGQELSEPSRYSGVDRLSPEFGYRLGRLMQWMCERGLRPKVFETWRSRERQRWLWGYGRTHHVGHPEVTWTKESRHEKGLAADVIDEQRGWSSGAFFDRLSEGAAKFGLETLPHDRGHVQMAGRR